MTDRDDKSEDRRDDKKDDPPLKRSAPPEDERRCPECKARPGDQHRKGCKYA